MNPEILGAIIGAIATIAAAIVGTEYFRKKTSKPNTDKDTAKEADTEEQKSVISASSISVGRDLIVQPSLVNSKFKTNSTGSRNAGLNIEVSHRGIKANPNARNPLELNESSSIVVTLMNLNTERKIFVPRIQIIKPASIIGFSSSFPNDEQTGANFARYARLIDLDRVPFPIEILDRPWDLNPTASLQIEVAFTGIGKSCHQLQICVHWKFADEDSGNQLLSEPFYITCRDFQTTWQEETEKAIERGDSVYARLAMGYFSFSQIISKLNANNRTQLIPIKFESKLHEFIILGNEYAIIPEIPPKDRYFESTFAPSRPGILIHSKQFASKCIGDFMSTKPDDVRKKFISGPIYDIGSSIGDL